MQFYNSVFSKKDTLHPQFEVRDNKVYPTLYNKEAGAHTALPWYEIKGNNIHTTTFNPQGHDVRPMYEIRGNDIHTTLYHSAHQPMPVMHIR